MVRNFFPLLLDRFWTNASLVISFGKTQRNWTPQVMYLLSTAKYKNLGCRNRNFNGWYYSPFIMILSLRLWDISCSCREWGKLECWAEATVLPRKGSPKAKQCSCSRWGNCFSWLLHWCNYPRNDPRGIREMHRIDNSSQNPHRNWQWSHSCFQWR